MTADQEKKARTVFAEALRADAGSREQIVRERSGGDEVVAREVLGWLAETTTDGATRDLSTPALGVGPGVLVGGRYLITEELSRGGFGVVFLAQDQNLMGKPVVLKVQLEAMPDDPWFERKFNDEIRALSLLDHPGIVHAIDSGKTNDGRLYLVMHASRDRDGQKLPCFGNFSALSIGGGSMRSAGVKPKTAP